MWGLPTKRRVSEAVLPEADLTAIDEATYLVFDEGNSQTATLYFEWCFDWFDFDLTVLNRLTQG